MALGREMTVLTEERVREIVLQVVEEEIQALRQELGRPGPEWGEVRQVWMAISALADAQRRTEERLEQLAEAQRRTEERLQRLEETVQALAEAQRRTEERLNQLAEAQRRTEERLGQLAETQRQMGDQLEGAIRSLADSVRRLADWTEVQIERLRRELGQLANRLGLDLEADAEEILWAVAAKKGMRILYRPTPIVMDGEVDLAAPVEMPDGTRGWVLIEVKGRLRKTELEDWVKVLKNPSFQEKLRLHGVTKPYLPYMFAVRVYQGVEDIAQESGIGILTFRGEMVPARFWE
ncbi:MAG: hypothetical protein NZ769_04520 [Anaerolineae bacterium]|nr:hypothetical protein [Anaerolineae bacterium]